MSTRVVMLLNQGGFINVYAKDREEALKWIADWTERNRKSIEQGVLDNTLFASPESAILCRHVIGLYIPQQEAPSLLAEAQMKIAKVMEECHKKESEGEEWKGRE
jgi:hypothetical protein